MLEGVQPIPSAVAGLDGWQAAISPFCRDTELGNGDDAIAQQNKECIIKPLCCEIPENIARTKWRIPASSRSTTLEMPQAFSHQAANVGRQRGPVLVADDDLQAGRPVLGGPVLPVHGHWG